MMARLETLNLYRQQPQLMSFSDLIHSLEDAIFGSPGATVLKYDGKAITVTGNKILQRTARDIQGLLEEADCKKATITLRQDGKVTISKGVAEHLHQRIRNLIANQ